MEEKPLNGIFRVSFDIEVNSSDQVSLSDVAQSLSEGLGEGLLERVSHLSVEKIEKHGKSESQILKVGYKVQLRKDIKAKVNIYSDDGYFFAGQKNEISELVVEEQEITLETGSIGFVNKINKDGSAEIVDLDRPLVNPLWRDAGIDAVNVDLITVNAEQLEKIDSKGGK